MHLDGTPPQAVRRAPGYLRFPKEFPEHAAGEGDTPPFCFFLFFIPWCAAALFVCSFPNPTRTTLFLLLLFPGCLTTNGCIKRQDFLLETPFGHRHCALDGWGRPVVCRIFASWRWQIRTHTRVWRSTWNFQSTNVSYFTQGLLMHVVLASLLLQITVRCCRRLSRIKLECLSHPAAVPWEFRVNALHLLNIPQTRTSLTDHLCERSQGDCKEEDV